MRLVGLLIGAVLVVYLGLQQFQNQGPQSPQVSTGIEQGMGGVSEMNLQSAASVLAGEHLANGTYAGAAVGSAGVTLVRADDASYCVQTNPGTELMHLAGPGGTPQPGPC